MAVSIVVGFKGLLRGCSGDARGRLNARERGLGSSLGRLLQPSSGPRVTRAPPVAVELSWED